MMRKLIPGLLAAVVMAGLLMGGWWLKVRLDRGHAAYVALVELSQKIPLRPNESLADGLLRVIKETPPRPE